MELPVQVDWAPAYELTVSLEAFLAKKHHKLLDLGPAWPASVRKALPAGFLAEARRLDAEKNKEKKEKLFFDWHVLARQCPNERDARSFIAWLRSLSPGDLYECLVAFLPSGYQLPRDLGGERDRLVRLLEGWDEGYFRNMDPMILKGLADSARETEASRRQVVGPDGRGSARFIERLTGGVVHEDIKAKVAVMVPQFHYYPYNLYGCCGDMALVLYPVRVVPPAEGEPPSEVIRVTKAISDPSRLKILRFLSETSEETPRTLTDISEAIGLAVSTVHHHMLVLRSAGLVRIHLAENRPDRYSHRQAALEEVRATLEEFIGRGATDET